VTLNVTDNAGCFQAVYTGHMTICNAPSTVTSQSVAIPAPTPPGGGGAVLPPDTTLPVFASASLTAKKFVVNRKGKAEMSVARSPKGTTFRYTLSEAARVVVTIERESTGRTVGRKCVKQTSKNRKRKKCKRYTKTGRFAITSTAGANRHAFSGRIGRKSLGVASYRASLVATDAAGNASKVKRLSFKVVRR
jgi:hypothetical protein